MKAFSITGYKKKQPLSFVDMPEPTLGTNDVLVDIHAAGVNQLDFKIRDGEFKLILPYKMPLTLGHDMAGVITKVGTNVKRFKAGDEVYTRPADGRIGTFAQYIAISEADVALKPKNTSMEEAASVPLVALTAWQALVERANLQKGQKVFIQAGSGGVGTMAIQLAKHLGATVATTTSASNIDLVKQLGADVVIDYKSQDFETILSDYDVVLNSQDAKTLEKSLRILKPGGKLISISGPPDPAFATEAGLNWLLKMVLTLLSYGIRRKAKSLGVSYSFLFMKASGSQLTKIKELIEAKIITPVIDKIYPFESTNEAINYVESGRSKGKVVVKMK